MDKGESGFIETLFVEEPFRRQGLGTYLLREAEELAKEKGAPMVLTSAGDWNVGFFNKNGYLFRGELKDVPKGHDCYELYKTLEAEIHKEDYNQHKTMRMQVNKEDKHE